MINQEEIPADNYEMWEKVAVASLCLIGLFSLITEFGVIWAIVLITIMVPSVWKVFEMRQIEQRVKNRISDLDEELEDMFKEPNIDRQSVQSEITMDNLFLLVIGLLGTILSFIGFHKGWIFYMTYMVFYIFHMNAKLSNEPMTIKLGLRKLEKDIHVLYDMHTKQKTKETKEECAGEEEEGQRGCPVEVLIENRRRQQSVDDDFLQNVLPVVTVLTVSLGMYYFCYPQECIRTVFFINYMIIHLALYGKLSERKKDFKEIRKFIGFLEDMVEVLIENENE